MANKKSNEAKPGERPPGKYHYNPGNMSGKTVDIGKDDPEIENSADKIKKP